MRYALTIAGHDPSSGAGLTADLKTFEAHGVYGFSVCSAITVQNDRHFEKVEWISLDLVISQIDILMQGFEIGFVKIGIIENMEILNEVLNFLKSKNLNVKVIWDPVLKTSSGFDFKHDPGKDLLEEIVGKCYLVTPNKPEWTALFSSFTENAEMLEGINILVKGGHDTGDQSLDLLYQSGEVLQISGQRLKAGKHGTGCVFSSAITANLALGKSLENACFLAKKYVSQFIMSNDTLLGEHTYA